MGADGGIYIITEAQTSECPHWDKWRSLPQARKQTDPFGNTVYTFYWDTERDDSFTDVWELEDEDALLELTSWIQGYGTYWETWS